jgi:molybdopterin adenylyltransferase
MPPTHSPQPHPDQAPLSVSCAVITLSDSRTRETDRSGQLIQALLSQAGHEIAHYALLPDEPDPIRAHLQHLNQQSHIGAILCNGGTGIAPRDGTYEALADQLDKRLDGFGELFRMLSYAEIGSRALASRAIAGTLATPHGPQLIFSMPGSSNAVRLAMEKLILPELRHLVKQVRPEQP